MLPSPMLPAQKAPRTLMVFGGFVVVCLIAAIALDSLWLLFAPGALLLAYQALADYRPLYFLLFALIPLSVEVELPGGFGTDFPDEPLMWALMGIYGLYLLQNGRQMSTAFFRHPLTILLMLHLGWIVVTTITSGNIFVSVKFFLAKIWYVAVFYFLAGSLLRSEKSVKTLFWSTVIPLAFTVVYVMIRHADAGFTFKDINFAVGPFYRNHVSYAAIMTLFLPFLWLARGWYARWSWPWCFIIGCFVLLLVGVQFTYTRAAYVALILAVGAWFVIRYRLMKVALALTTAGAIALVAYLVNHGNYLEYQPDYNKAISHQQFDKLVEATYKMEDISTMERLYRWVAGAIMSQEHPLTGFGPGNFYNYYKSYTVTGFRTYVSDNPEHSGIHCYYLMVLVEQGYVGLLLFVALVFYALLYAERLYHHTADPARQRIVMAATLSLITIVTLILINDMIETDKVGTFFFTCLALLVNQELAEKPGENAA